MFEKNKNSPFFKKINILCFRETHSPGPDIHSGKTGHDLPVFEVGNLEPEVFAAFTGPDGGLTSICNLGDKMSAAVLQVNNVFGLLYEQCDKIGRFFRFLATNCLAKVAQIFWGLLGPLIIMSLFCKKCVATFGAIFFGGGIRQLFILSSGHTVHELPHELDIEQT